MIGAVRCATGTVERRGRHGPRNLPLASVSLRPTGRLRGDAAHRAPLRADAEERRRSSRPRRRSSHATASRRRSRRSRARRGWAWGSCTGGFSPRTTSSARSWRSGPRPRWARWPPACAADEAGRVAGTITALAGSCAATGLFDAVAEAGGRPQLLEVARGSSRRSHRSWRAARAAEAVRDDVTVFTDLVTLASIVTRVPPSARRGRRPDLAALPRPRARRAAARGGVGAAAGALPARAVERCGGLRSRRRR